MLMMFIAYKVKKELSEGSCIRIWAILVQKNKSIIYFKPICHNKIWPFTSYHRSHVNEEKKISMGFTESSFEIGLLFFGRDTPLGFLDIL